MHDIRLLLANEWSLKEVYLLLVFFEIPMTDPAFKVKI